MTPTPEMIALAQVIANGTGYQSITQEWRSCYTCALAAIMEVREKPWKPFKDAPRDGTKIDVWIKSDLGGYRVCNIIFKNGFWYSTAQSYPYDFHRTPTHFMIAPDGPSATGNI